jgi:ketosteroid isomerase-like protein
MFDGILGDAYAVLEAQRGAWNNGDVALFMEGYEHADDITFVSPVGVKRSYTTLMLSYASRYATREAMGTLSFQDVEMRLISDTVALAIGRFVVAPTAGEASTGFFSLVLRKSNVGWRIVHDHTS